MRDVCARNIRSPPKFIISNLFCSEYFLKRYFKQFRSQHCYFFREEKNHLIIIRFQLLFDPTKESSYRSSSPSTLDRRLSPSGSSPIRHPCCCLRKHGSSSEIFFEGMGLPSGEGYRLAVVAICMATQMPQPRASRLRAHVLAFALNGGGPLVPLAPKRPRSTQALRRSIDGNSGNQSSILFRSVPTSVALKAPMGKGWRSKPPS